MIYILENACIKLNVAIGDSISADVFVVFSVKYTSNHADNPS